MPDTASNATSSSAAAPVMVEAVSFSLVWAETLPQFLKLQVPSSSPWSVLTRSDTYKTAFSKAQKEASTPLDPAQPTHLQPPWGKSLKQNFWIYYLTEGNLPTLAGSLAWKNLIPLRGPSPCTLELDATFNGQVTIEPYYYPFGMALAINFLWKPHLAPGDLVTAALALRRTQKFTTSASTVPLTLDQFASQTLKAMREQCLGPGATPGVQSIKPFSIFTVTSATGVDATIDLKTEPVDFKSKDSPFRIFEALSNWRLDWATGGIPPISDTCLPNQKRDAAGTILYAGDRGRAVWFPGLFTPPISAAPSISCYHHNLVFAAVQVEALAQLMHHTAALFRDGKRTIDLTATHKACAENGALALATMYSVDKDKTWRSASVKRHIKEACYKDLDTVLDAFDHPVLDPPPKPPTPVTPS